MRFDSDIKIFAGSASRDLTRRICEALEVPIGKNTVIHFSEGNTYVKLDEKVRGKDIYIVQTIGLDPNNEMMELLFWLDAAKRSGVNSVTAIIPYFSYAKADKKDEPRVSIRARVCADCIETAGVDRVVMMDLHSPQIQGFFKKPVDHLYAANIFCDHIQRQSYGDFAIVSPDVGFAKNARYYANRLRVPLVIGTKERAAHDEKAEITSLIGDVRGKNAIIVDDFAISCGTLVDIARVLKVHGVNDIYVYASHELISEKGAAALMASPIKQMFTTDTVSNPVADACERISIISVASLFAKAIKIIHEQESLTALFE